MFEQFAAPAAPPAAVHDGAPYLYASRTQRLIGAIIDYIPSGVVIVVVAGLPHEDSPLLPTYLLGSLIVFVAIFAIQVIQWVLISRRGQSVGKIIAGTRIILKEGGKPVSFKSGVMLRNWLMNIASSVSQGILGLIDPLLIFREDHRCMHDHFAGTIVVDASYDPRHHTTTDAQAASASATG